MNYQAPQIEWTEKERENIGGIAIQATTATHTYHIFQGDLDKEWICSYYRHSGGKAKFKILPTSQELKEWVETTHYPSALIKAGFKPASEPPADTLVEKLEQEVKRMSELRAKTNPYSFQYPLLGHHIAATVNAINIVKQHEDETCDWKMNDIGEWDYFNTSCGQAQYFGSDGITENNYKYCPFCGKPIKDITEYEVQDD